MNRHMRAASGACLFGPDGCRWPAAWADAVTAMEAARISEHNARLRAEMDR